MESSNATPNGTNLESIYSEVEAKHRAILVQWLNSLLPTLSLPTNISDNELRLCLSNGNVLCQILNRLRPGSVNMVSDSDYSLPSRSENVKRFMAAMDGLGLPRFELSDLEKGSMEAVVYCLLTLKAKSLQNALGDNIFITNSTSESPRGNGSLCVHCSPCREEQKKISSETNYQHVLRSPGRADPSAVYIHHVGHKFNELFQLKHGSCVDLHSTKISEMMRSHSLDNAPTQSLLSFVNGILDESVEKRNGEMPHHVARLLRKVIQEIERRISTQAEHLRIQHNLFKAREEKYKSRITVLEALASGTRDESEIVASQLQQLKTENTKVEEKKKAHEEDVIRLVKEQEDKNREISTLKQELETTKITYKSRCSQLEAEAQGTKRELKQKSEEYEHLLEDLRDKVKELEAFSESEYDRWTMKKNQLQHAVDFQFSSIQKMKLLWQSIKQDVMMEQRIYIKECSQLVVDLKSLAYAAEKYHDVLAENRRMFNEIEELRGNIRVYCRIRPFILEQIEKQSIIENVGEDYLVVANPSKQGKDALRSFKFNKIFGPATTQVEVYSDVQLFIRSVLDGYNVCIFAYGQTGSGKTYTMSGPNGATEETFGVNYRALNDLFGISSSRKSSITYEIGVQMVEIYNEQVRDLLSTDSSRKRLGISTNSSVKGLAVPDAIMFPVKSTSDVMELMDIGLKSRAVGGTALNERSSRSHSVVSVHVRGTDLKSSSTLHGNLHLVDLAGSERIDRSEVTGDRLREAQHINKSLSALGDVIFALAQKSAHVPYRNSKLTQLLQSSLGGQAKTLMFVQVNSDVNSFSETLSTLKFAERVTGVELGAAQNSKEVTSLKDTILEKDEEIERLRLLKDLKSAYPIGSNGHSEAPLQQPMDGLKHQNEFLQRSKVAGGDIGHNIPADADYDERLSDVSDLSLSVRKKSNGSSKNSVLSIQSTKSSENMRRLKAASKAVRGMQKAGQSKDSVSRDSVKMTSSLKRTPGGSNQLKASRRWQ